MKSPAGLGRGLAALMSDIAPAGPPEGDDQTMRGSRVPIERLVPNPDQPRTHFSEDALEGLAASIREKGVIQPLIVRKGQADGTFEIVAGERRWRAAQRAGLHDLPVILKDYDDSEVLEIAIIENIQRADLNPIEEAAGFRQLMQRFGHTQERIAESLSKSRSYIANSVRLLSLPDDVQSLLKDGNLTAGHGRALVGRPDAGVLAARIVKRGLSVRETEDLVRKAATRAGGERPAYRTGRREKDPDTLALEGDLAANLRMGVSIRHEPGGDRGTLTITYNTLEQLDALCRTLSRMDPDPLS